MKTIAFFITKEIVENNYAGWPKKNATLWITNFKDIINLLNLFFSRYNVYDYHDCDYYVTCIFDS